MLEIILIVILIICALYLVTMWIRIYNNFVLWRQILEQNFAAIDVIMERRIAMLPALTQIAAKYGVHEYKTIKDTIEARGNWSKDTPLAEKVDGVAKVAAGLLNIQAVFEKYPNVKADRLYQQIMGGGNVSELERELQHYRLKYNYIVNLYNTRVQLFPNSIVANAHSFKIVPYLELGNNVNQEKHAPYETGMLFEK